MIRYYELLYTSRDLLAMLQSVGGNAADVGMLAAYMEYKRLLADGNKKEYIFAVMKDKYQLGRKAMLSIAEKMERVVIV